MERERKSVCVCACVRARYHAHVFEDVGIREFSRHIGLESLVRRDNMEEDGLLGKGEGERGLQMTSAFLWWDRTLLDAVFFVNG